MGYTAVSFANPLSLPQASLVEGAGIGDQQLLPELKMADYCFEGIIGTSPAIKKVLEQVAIVAPTDATVLLHGETGTGKELVANAVHNLSCRRGRTFVRMNCAAIPSGLLESDLFGHEKGAFTGALIQKKGRFELADRGSLFLDEIGDISLELQPKLLRAVQEREFERLGSARTIQVDVRMIVATHRDLPAMIREGKFREDLFYRFNVFPIEIPPLRERREDIPLLASYFMKNLERRMGKKIRNITPEMMAFLMSAPWKGNVRELANFIERAVILATGEELELSRAELRTCQEVLIVAELNSTFRQAESTAIIDALKAASGRIAGRGGAAARLGLKRTTLQNKMRQLNICRTDYSSAKEMTTEVSVAATGACIMSACSTYQQYEADAILAEIVRGSDDAIFSKTLDAVITSWNPAAEHMYGYVAQEVIGRPVSILLPPERPDDVKMLMGRILNGERVQHHETIRKHKDGRRVHVSLTVSPIRDKLGRIVGAATVARDITAKRQAEEALRGVDKLAAMGRMAASIAHEIRSPLEVSKNLTYLLLHNGHPDPNNSEILTTLDEQLTRMSEISSWTLSFARKRTETSKVAITAILDETLALARTNLLAKQVSVERRFDSPGELIGQAGPLRQVCVNLITNALDALPRGGHLTLHVDDLCHPSTGVAGVRLLVADNGTGIEPEHRGDLFRAFFSTKQEKGTGLGLWACSEIVTQHGGSIRFRTKCHGPGTGTCFSVFLPKLAASKTETAT